MIVQQWLAWEKHKISIDYLNLKNDTNPKFIHVPTNKIACVE